MKALNVHEAKTQLSALLKEIEEKGERFVICRDGKPVADLSAHKPASRLVQDPMLADTKIHYDPTEPASEEDWPEAAR
jgi:antitoxin (DNA-binding transcriptional repressor) of toxin-antitoxin stability system